MPGLIRVLAKSAETLLLRWSWLIQEMDYRMDEYIHHLDSEIGRSESIILAHFGAPPVSRAKEIDNVEKKSLYCNNLRQERP